jgi:hypothetical protein
MNVETVPLSELHEDPANVRSHPDRNIETIKASLLKFGQQKPIVVRENGIVIAGNGTLRAAKDLGWKTLEVVRTALQSTDATAYAIADNRTAELATWEYKELSDMVRALQAEEFDLSVLGWSEDELRAMLNAEFVPGAPDGTTGKDYPQAMADPIKLTQEQRAIFDRAAAKVRARTEQTDMSDGRCCELICAEFLAGA